MLDGICPKCGSEQVYSGADVPRKQGYHGANTIPIKGNYMDGPALDNYVCTACGYVESYISDRPKLDEITQTWSKVKP
jgi:hypothetical protein